jgi:hypothetical protein
MWPTMRATDNPRGRTMPVIIAFVPIGVGHDGLASHFVERDLLRAVARRSGDGNRGRHGIRISYGPLQSLHGPHGSTRNCEQPVDTQMIDQHLLQPHHVRNRNRRKGHP